MQFDFTSKGMLAVSHLRFKKLWVGTGLLLIAGVIAGSIVSVPDVGISANDKAVHLIVYASLMGWFAQIFRHDLTRLLLVIGLVAMGIAIEFAQGAVPYRRFEVLDMVANTSGVVLAWALAYTWVGNILPWFETGVCRLFFPDAEPLCEQHSASARSESSP